MTELQGLVVVPRLSTEDLSSSKFAMTVDPQWVHSCGHFAVLQTFVESLSTTIRPATRYPGIRAGPITLITMPCNDQPDVMFWLVK